MIVDYIDQFCSKMAFPSEIDIQVADHSKEMDPRSSLVSPLHSTLDTQKLTIHLYKKALIGISPMALQGWLNMELARCQLVLEPSMYRINFDKKIRTIFNISGSGHHVVRHMVAHLENSLKNLIAAQIVIEIGNSSPLLHYCYHRINPSIEDGIDYERLFPHQWVRAIFLCKKNKDYMPVAVLADSGIANELESYWWQCHRYLSTEDRQFLKALFKIAKHNPVKYFSDTMVEMFTLVTSQFLIP
jgi:hypothetical protein